MTLIVLMMIKLILNYMLFTRNQTLKKSNFNRKVTKKKIRKG